MNNANAIALIETGAMSTEKMLDLCEKATDNYNDDPRRTAVVRAFVRNWKSVNHLASNQDFINVVVGCSNSVQACSVYAVASEWSREDFEYAFQKLSCNGDLIFVAGPSGEYTQEEVLDFANGFKNNNYNINLLQYWELVIDIGVLDAEGLYKVASEARRYECPYHHIISKEIVCIKALLKKLMSAEQMMEICGLYDSSWDITLAAITTGLLSDEQVLLLINSKTAYLQRRPENFWGILVPHLRFSDRTVDDLITLGEKANSDKLWPSIVEVINSKKAVQA